MTNKVNHHKVKIDPLNTEFADTSLDDFLKSTGGVIPRLENHNFGNRGCLGIIKLLANIEDSPMYLKDIDLIEMTATVVVKDDVVAPKVVSLALIKMSGFSGRLVVFDSEELLPYGLRLHGLPLNSRGPITDTSLSKKDYLIGVKIEYINIFNGVGNVAGFEIIMDHGTKIQATALNTDIRLVGYKRTPVNDKNFTSKFEDLESTMLNQKTPDEMHKFVIKTSTEELELLFQMQDPELTALSKGMSIEIDVGNWS